MRTRAEELEIEIKDIYEESKKNSIYEWVNVTPLNKMLTLNDDQLDGMIFIKPKPKDDYLEGKEEEVFYDFERDLVVKYTYWLEKGKRNLMFFTTVNNWF